MTNDSVGYSQFLVMHRVLLSPGTDTVIPGDSLERPQEFVWGTTCVLPLQSDSKGSSAGVD